MPDTTQAQGTYGQHHAHADFYGTAAPFNTSGLNTEVIAYVVDEPDGVISLTTGGADDDTACVVAQACFTAAKNGPLALETRWKAPVITNNAEWTGFSTKDPNVTRIIDNTTLEATATVEAAGISFDSGYDAAVLSTIIATGSVITHQDKLTETVVADKYTISRVEVDPDGSVRCYVGVPYGKDGVGVGSLRLVNSYGPGAIDKTALLYASTYTAGNTSATTVAEVDYMHLTAGRCWTA